MAFFACVPVTPCLDVYLAVDRVLDFTTEVCVFVGFGGCAGGFVAGPWSGNGIGSVGGDCIMESAICPWYWTVDFICDRFNCSSDCGAKGTWEKLWTSSRFCAVCHFCRVVFVWIPWDVALSDCGCFGKTVVGIGQNREDLIKFILLKFLIFLKSKKICCNFFSTMI